jgi:hypothetical protein
MLGGSNPSERKVPNMKTITKTLTYLQLTVLCTTAALADVNGAEKDKPFHGSIQAVEIVDVQYPTLVAHGRGTGHASYLGRFTVTYEFEVNIPAASGTGPAHFVAANGDSLFTEVIGQGYPVKDPDLSFIIETHTITGGTGRFAGATGRFTLERLNNLVTGVSSGSFEGTISLRDHRGGRSREDHTCEN